MARIFISYKRVDKEKVFKIKKRLESALGIECWIDLSGIESDAQFTNVIIKAIRECEIVLFMYSKAHGNIENVEKDWTTRELNFAEAKGKRVVFINIDGAPLTDLFLFNYGTKQQVDAKSETAMAKLEEDLSQWLGLKKESESETGEDNPEVDQKAKPQSRPKPETKKKFPARLVAAAACFVVAMVLLILPKNTPTTGTIAGHKYIDLGLPSGTLWATCNVGTSMQELPGNHYAWGETEKRTVSSSDYKYYEGFEYTKYVLEDSRGTADHNGSLESGDDAARVNWGGSWRIPTEKEWLELKNNCTWEWATIGNHEGYKVSNNATGASIFLPACGAIENGRTLFEEKGLYMSANLRWTTDCKYMSFGADEIYISSGDRSRGYSVRPVSSAIKK